MTYKETLEFARQMRKKPTEAEARFWEKVRGRRFMGKKFTRQYIVKRTDNPTGNNRYFIVDFYCHEMKLIVELDGGIHLTQVEYDQAREDILKDRGYQVIRFSNQEILHHWNTIAERLKAFDKPSELLTTHYK